ncbi:hypothetical protein [Aquifex sp.]
MDFLKNKAKEILKNFIKEKIEETDFGDLILSKVNEETQEIIAEKAYTALIEALKNLDDETVARLAIQAKYKLIEAAQKNNETIKKIVKDTVKNVIKSLEEDEEMRKRLNERIKEIVLNAVEKY